MTTANLSLMGAGFIGSHYASLYPYTTHVEPRDAVVPVHPDTLYLRSTVSNYNVLNPETLKLDVETNLIHLLDVLPNVRGVFNMVSSWFVYGNNPEIHQRYRHSKETDACRPTGMYSLTKHCAEGVVQSYCATAAAGLVTGPSGYRILRLSNVIGNDPRAGKTKNALEHMLSLVVEGKEVEVYEGDCYRDILHVSDTCRAINLCLTKAALSTHPIINVGRGQSHRIIDLIDYAIKATGSKSTIRRVPVPTFHRIVQTADFWMDTTLLKGLGFTPQYTIEQSIDAVLEGVLCKRALEGVSAYTDYVQQNP